MINEILLNRLQLRIKDLYLQHGFLIDFTIQNMHEKDSLLVARIHTHYLIYNQLKIYNDVYNFNSVFNSTMLLHFELQGDQYIFTNIMYPTNLDKALCDIKITKNQKNNYKPQLINLIKDEIIQKLKQINFSTLEVKVNESFFEKQAFIKIINSLFKDLEHLENITQLSINQHSIHLDKNIESLVDIVNNINDTRENLNKNYNKYIDHELKFIYINLKDEIDLLDELISIQSKHAQSQYKIHCKKIIKYIDDFYQLLNKYKNKMNIKGDL